MTMRKFNETMMPTIATGKMKAYREHAADAFKAARKKKNVTALTAKFCEDEHIDAHWYDPYQTLITCLWFAMSDYTTIRRAQIAGREVSDDDLKGSRNLVYKCWKNLLSFGDLHATAADTEMLWLAMEKYVDNKPGQNTPKVFSRLVEREIGIRIERLESMTPEVTEYNTRLTKIRRGLSSKKTRAQKLDDQIKALKALKIEGADDSVKEFVKNAIADAEEKAKTVADEIESLEADKAALTQEVVNTAIAEELAFTL